MGSLKDQLLGDIPYVEPSQAFGGSTYNSQHDYRRLTGQLQRVFTIMQDGKWRTLAELSAEAGGTEAAVSARLRDLRKPIYGRHVIDRRRVGTSGLFQYRLFCG